MKIGIVGLGLIGGSLAKAFSSREEVTVYGVDKDTSMIAYAELAGAIDGTLDVQTLGQCDCVFIALYPEDTVRYLEENGRYLSKTAMVIDCCGIKEYVCRECFRIAGEHGFTFVGGHPMAGRQYSGFKHSRNTLFKNESMILVPEDYNDLYLIQRAKTYLEPLGFGKITVTTAEKHDAMIAFTSQMPHVLSNAFIKSPTALLHKGFSAGSYKDFTRVAYLNEEMWAELFIANKEALAEELGRFVEELSKYRQAIEDGDQNTLKVLLAEGKACKVEVDTRCRQS